MTTNPSSIGAVTLSIEVDEHGKLSVSPKSALTDEFRQFIRDNRERFIALGGKQRLCFTPQDPDEAAATAQSRWLVHYPDREPLTASCSPEVIQAEILAARPDAVATEPFTPSAGTPSKPVTAAQQAAVRAWLASIGEQDPATIAEVLSACRRDIESRLTNTNVADCASCRHRRSPGGMVRYCASGRSDLPLAYGDGHPLRRLPDDQGHCCTQWSGLIQRGVD